MITGFTREALVIMPLIEDYADKSMNYHCHIVESVRRIKKYLNACNITMDAFFTDDVMRDVNVEPDRWLITLNQGDTYFVKRNCKGMDALFTNRKTFDDMYADAAAKYPLEQGSSADKRFETILKRDAYTRRSILKTYKMVILFKQPKTPAMRINPKKGSGVLLVEVDNTTFTATCYIGDMQADAFDILGIANGSAPVYEWEV